MASVGVAGLGVAALIGGWGFSAWLGQWWTARRDGDRAAVTTAD